MKSKEKYIFTLNSESIPLNANIIGGKTLNLAKLLRIGMPIPNGIVISSQVHKIYQSTKKIPACLSDCICEELKKIHADGNSFSTIFSVRSSPSTSHPGFLKTVLNVGITSKNILSLTDKFEDSQVVWDMYRRLIYDIGVNLFDIDEENFKMISKKHYTNVIYPNEGLDSLNRKKIAESYLEIFEKKSKKTFPDDTIDQILFAVECIYIDLERKKSNKVQNIDLDLGILIQPMVFGNLNRLSGSGVLTTRDFLTGDKNIYIEYINCAQGDKLVSGILTPDTNLLIKNIELVENLKVIASSIEEYFNSPQEIEFTVEDSKIWILQSRNMNCNPIVKAKILLENFKKNKIGLKELKEDVDINYLYSYEEYKIDLPKKEISNKIICIGSPSSNGIVTGKLVIGGVETSETVIVNHFDKKQIFVFENTSSSNLSQILKADGIITTVGGTTSHAAVVTRILKKPCVTSCKDITIDYLNKQIIVNNIKYKEGELLTINGNTGEVFRGELSIVKLPIKPFIQELIDLIQETKSHIT